ncbi:hypothetical protein Hbl1158_07745 [Halobaculum sp. CBA1158]|uniref:hypothetical protein n=1 Tax=Halobaculum sp. CBA1158 TaxID=2904243 RepID=UPI001F3C085A|nr:hypothetical protein [Halobaculum sp. CBA1158]UIO98458.1 hypothetical protein Hbl1158_07745 [Halobaculum sp. CBA1158]
MPRDIPTEEKSVRERGTYANDGNDPTIASYLSSLFFLLSVPALVSVTYVGYWGGLYGESAVVPIFAGLLIASIAGVFAVMHVTTGR